jgi:sterol desaturase/sphingolipid hydroxylase (fatty acid hydroxylase superfamily)
MILLLAAIAAVLLVIERIWPANELPSSKGWWIRVALINTAQVGVIIIAGLTWDRWFQNASLFHLRDHFSNLTSAAICYFVSTFIYYWWHRIRHESKFFWRLCHQLHHSTRRIEILASFYKHPVEITINSLISATLTYAVLGITVEAAALYTFFTAIAEYFYHWNIRTPRWLGPWFQRPESHRVHHQYQHHTQNYADLPIWDILFKTYHNPEKSPAHCGFDEQREANFPAMLAFKDVHKIPPTCVGCRKRWACYTQKQTAPKS